MAELIPKKITITQTQKKQLINLAEDQIPGEACGVIGGENGVAKEVFPIRNISRNTFTYKMDPEEQVAAFFEIDEMGLSPQDAIITASQKRLRPILLTTATTVLGLLPLYLGGGEMWEPMAIAIMAGLLFSTILTLGIIPVLYSLLYRVKY